MKKQYDSDEINELANQIDLFEYISEQLEPKKRSGNNYFFSCPLHSDSDPSLAVDTKQNYFKCFSCLRGGNALSWMMQYEGLSYRQAAEKVQKIVGKNATGHTNSESVKFFRKMQKLKERSRINETSTREYQNYLDYEKYSTTLPEIWLQEGISEEALRTFNIRTDPIKNRILYPIYDSDGKYICPKARTTLSTYKLLGIPKYKYLGYIGSNDFFIGWKENKENICNSGKVILFEGIKSVMKAWDWGYKNTLACETATINDDQVKFLVKNRIKDVTIAFDSDKKIKDIIPRLQVLKKYTNLFAINDTHKLLGDKESPVDRGREVFEQLLNERIRI